jgi:DNA-directed RNA polymerase subunit F
MTQPQIVSEEAINIYEVKEALNKIEKEGLELSFRSGRTKEYIENISQINLKKSKEIKEKIIALDIPRFKDEYISKIIDICPLNVEDLKQLISSFNITLKENYVKEILKILHE